MLCKYCGRECKNNNSLINHERLCKQNPAKQISWLEQNRNNVKSWNKGLTKNTDSRVAKNAKNTSNGMKKLIAEGKHPTAWTSEFWTAEARKNKSEEKKALYLKHPEKHPNRKLAGNRSKMTYPERVAFDFLTASGIKFIHQHKILGYYVDFCIDSTIIEIDGEHWHPIGNDKDTNRDLELIASGYSIHRIRSKERIEERLKEIFSR